MAGGGDDADSRSLEQTPTWAVAIVCFGFVLVSILIERSIHWIAKWLQKRRMKSLSEALEKIKAELMLLGFISLLLTVGQKPISEICISESLGDSLLPCPKVEDEIEKLSLVAHQHHRKLMFGAGAGRALFSEIMSSRRMLATDESDQNGHCARKGKVPLISQDGLHQLHIFIFVLAVFHVLSCIITMALGRAKMKRWKTWEQETKTLDYEFSTDPSRFRFTRQTTFGRRHMNFWSTTPILVWIVCFFRQFVRSVPKVDYLTLRHGFILAHFAPHGKFDFQRYIKRSLDDDFIAVVSISPPLWLFAILFLLLNRNGWFTYLWLSFVPLIILLIVGTKLQVIITEMALDIQERNPVVQGPPVVTPNDKLFWFGRPRWILHLIHFTLFQNAFQFAFFFWAWYEYGLKSCFHEKARDIISRLTVGIVVQILCSYVTLPLYALVTQMGTNMKTSIFDERIAESLKKWHQSAKRNIRRNIRRGENISISGQSTPAEGSSPLHLLHKYKSAGSLESRQNVDQSEYELSDFETDTPSPSHHSRHNANNSTEAEQQHMTNKNEEIQSDTQNIQRNGSEFSFAHYSSVNVNANFPAPSMRTQ